MVLSVNLRTKRDVILVNKSAGILFKLFSLHKKLSGGLKEMTTMQIEHCNICLEGLRCEGDHQICCLPCGHLLGFSCIIKWIQQSYEVSAKCPMCKMLFREPDVRKIYGSPVVLDQDLLDGNLRLEDENQLLTQENDNLRKEITELKEQNHNLCEENTELREQMNIHGASSVKDTIQTLVLFR